MSDALVRNGDPAGRGVAAYAVALLGPALAWLTWISWTQGKPSDALHVAWFATVAALCLLAGALAPRGGWHLAALSVLAWVATVVTLFLWWGSEDSSGLFLVGILLAAPLLAGAAPALLAIGGALGRAVRSGRRPGRPAPGR